MDLLPELLKTALTSACNSGRSLSWKLQESVRGTFIQLVWKHEPETSPDCGKPTGVGSNWKRSVVPKDPGKPARKKRISPSKARRNASRLQAFLVKKNVESHVTQEVFDSSTQASQSLGGKNVDIHISQQSGPIPGNKTEKVMKEMKML